MSPELDELTDRLADVADYCDGRFAYGSAQTIRDAAVLLEQQELEIEKLRAKVARVEKLIQKWIDCRKDSYLWPVIDLKSALFEPKEQA